MSFCCNYAKSLLYQNILKLLIRCNKVFKTNHARNGRCFICMEKKICRESLIGWENIVQSYKLLA